MQKHGWKSVIPSSILIGVEVILTPLGDVISLLEDFPRRKNTVWLIIALILIVYLLRVGVVLAPAISAGAAPAPRPNCWQTSGLSFRTRLRGLPIAR
jgi:hypothetical protein